LAPLSAIAGRAQAQASIAGTRLLMVTIYLMAST